MWGRAYLHPKYYMGQGTTKMELEQCINYLLSIAQNTVFKKFSGKLEPYGITPSQYGVLNCLWSGQAETPKQLCGCLRLEASSISSILDRMQVNGLIERNIDPNDRRTIRVNVTDRGEALRNPIMEIINNINQDALNFLEPEQKAFLLKTLLIIADSKA